MTAAGSLQERKNEEVAGAEQTVRLKLREQPRKRERMVVQNWR